MPGDSMRECKSKTELTSGIHSVKSSCPLTAHIRTDSASSEASRSSYSTSASSCARSKSMPSAIQSSRVLNSQRRHWVSCDTNNKQRRTGFAVRGTTFQLQSGTPFYVHFKGTACPVRRECVAWASCEKILSFVCVKCSLQVFLFFFSFFPPR